MDAIARLMRPRSVAVVGASSDATRTAGRPVAYLQKHRFAGEIYPVNPRLGHIGGLKCYPDVDALPAPPDVGIVLLGPERTAEAVRLLAARGAAAAIVVASGYAEAGPEGARRQQELKSAAGAMRLLGPNTIGLVNLNDGIMLSATGALEMEALPAGNIAMVSQSGGMLGALLSRAAGRGIGCSKLVSTGNEADLEVSDFVEYLLHDDATAVIALYLEGLRDPGRFRAAALEARRIGKPLVVFKVGRSASGARSAVSHTGALAGADRVYDALFRQVGAIRVTRLAELIDVPLALASRRTLRGRRVAILTSTGGAATLVADSCGLAGFDTPPLDQATALRLAGIVSGDPSPLGRNPVDVTLAGAKPELLRRCIGALLESPGVDALIAVVGSSALAQPEPIAAAIVDGLGSGDKPLLAYVSPHAPHIVRMLSAAGLPAFDVPESCAAALTAMLERSGRVSHVPAAPAAAQARLPAGLPGTGPFNEFEAKQLFKAFGIAGVREIAADTPAAAQEAGSAFGARVVLKVLTRHLAHKTEAGGVRLGVAAEAIAQGCEEMRRAVRSASGIEPEGFLVQEQVSGGVELILGLHRDPQLGPALLLGLGGIAAEVFEDTAIRLLPLGREDAEAMVRELKSHRLLTGFRGRPPADVDALVQAMLAFAAMAGQLGERLAQAEINPLFVLPQGQGVRAADGVVVLS